MDISLTRPTIELKGKALNYRQEHFDYGEKIINGSELFDQTDLYEEWLIAVTNNTNSETVNPDWVITDTFFAIDNDTQRIVGIIDLRHTLKGFLIDFGNCGYSVRPSERNKGIATEMLKQLLAVAKQVGLDELHLSVEQNNTPSIKTITKNGGIYERSFEHEGVLVDIYQITL